MEQIFKELSEKYQYFHNNALTGIDHNNINLNFDQDACYEFFLDLVNGLPLASCSALIENLESIEQWIREVHRKVANENVNHNSHISSPNHSLNNTALLSAIRNDDTSTFHNLIDEMVSDIKTENEDEVSENRMINQANPAVQKAFSVDIYGKNPLHYAAIKGFERITRILLEYLMRVEQFSLEMGFNDNVWFDDDGYTPLFYATLNNNVDVIDCIIEICQVNDVDNSTNVPKLMNSSTSTATQTLLAISCKFGHYSVAKSLLNHRANPNVQDEDGETPLHLASRGGFTDCCLLLIREHDANMEIREKYSGWTPLFLAVEALIQSGAIHNIVDYSGWTPHMHALFRGHLTMKNILRPPSGEINISSLSTNHEIMVSPQENVSRQETSAEMTYQNMYLKDDSLIFITLGTTDIRKDIVPIKFNDAISFASPVSIVVWAINATGEKVTIDLPIKDNIAIDPIMFYAQEQDINDVTLIFDIMPIYGPMRQLIGRATAALSSIKTYSGPNHTSLIGSVTVPILGSLGLGVDVVIGKIQFEYLVEKENEDNSVEEDFNEAYSNDDSSSTLSSNSSGNLKRSNSMSSINKAKYRKIDENNIGKLKGNGAGTIQAPFTTLEETFKGVPVNIGFNIEVKYPMVVEAEEFNLHPFYTELNSFCDAILKCVYEHAQPERKIMFSSFHPETCLMLSFKQPNCYPVLFLSDCGIYNMADARCNSLQAAIRFAKFAGLSGIVANCDPIIEAPGLTKIVKKSGLLLFTYGRLNNVVANAQLQKRAGVDAVIVDSVKQVKQGLEQIDNEDQIENIVN
ncbi:17736_t:CDS:2 [Racocetra fulgida]|uniref:17736_t:CDS:1 n=1 Tax=Racocetra fulgida TaxID=60492 RepID=A0A9N9BM34_9GLOM|nr:17736_t:CDS:2 [Racocetra fulgida]